MSNTSQFSLANRKHLAEMLTDKYDGLRSKMKRRFHDKEQELYATYLNEYAEKKGATKLIAQIKAAELETEQRNHELGTLGFELEGSDLRLLGGSDNPLDKIIDARVAKEIGTSCDIDARFDSAQLAMMTVATLQDAEKLLKTVSEI